MKTVQIKDIAKGNLVTADLPAFCEQQSVIGKVIDVSGENITLEDFNGQIWCLLSGDIVSACEDTN